MSGESGVMMGADHRFRLRNHTADVAVEATASTLDGLFAAVADGLTAVMCETVPDGGERFRVTVTAESREALLFEYLDELIYQRDVRRVLPCDHETTIRTDCEWSVEATARGVPFDDVSAREVKAVTYSEMSLTKTANGWVTYVVFDV